MPVVNAPFRLYWAYNLSYVNTNLIAPSLVQPAEIPGNFQNAFQNLLGQAIYDERRSCSGSR